MSNMSYCRFENTSRDLAECVITMEEAENLAEMDLSLYEKEAMEHMRSLAVRFIEQFDNLVYQSARDKFNG